MQHSMRLKNVPFLQIKNGLKSIELRLCDDKREREFQLEIVLSLSPEKVVNF